MADRPKYVLISMMRDEAPYILDWVAHHRALGFDHLVVFHNDCSDNTVNILNNIARYGYMTVIENHHGAGGLQRTALRRARRERSVKQADWIYICDADEYLNIHIGNHRIEDLVQSVPEDTDSISVIWRNFSTNHHLEITRDRMPVAFTDATAPLSGKGKVPSCKSITRNIHKLKRLGTHQPIPLAEYADDFIRRAPGGAELQTKHDYISNASYEIAQVNHYAVRSIDGFLIKKSRMRVNHAGSVDLGYFESMGIGGYFDDTILRYEALKEPYWAEFQQNEGLMRLHQRAVRKHRLKVEQLMENPEFRELREKILSIAQSNPVGIRPD